VFLDHFIVSELLGSQSTLVMTKGAPTVFAPHSLHALAAVQLLSPSPPVDVPPLLTVWLILTFDYE